VGGGGEVHILGRPFAIFRMIQNTFDQLENWLMKLTGQSVDLKKGNNVDDGSKKLNINTNRL
jgi:hypothetical protein